MLRHNDLDNHSFKFMQKLTLFSSFFSYINKRCLLRTLYMHTIINYHRSSIYIQPERIPRFVSAGQQKPDRFVREQQTTMLTRLSEALQMGLRLAAKSHRECTK